MKQVQNLKSLVNTNWIKICKDSIKKITLTEQRCKIPAQIHEAKICDILYNKTCYQCRYNLIYSNKCTLTSPENETYKSRAIMIHLSMILVCLVLYCAYTCIISYVPVSTAPEKETFKTVQ